jgi:predicted metalloendopeptidase
VDRGDLSIYISRNTTDPVQRLNAFRYLDGFLLENIGDLGGVSAVVLIVLKENKSPGLIDGFTQSNAFISWTTVREQKSRDW